MSPPPSASEAPRRLAAALLLALSLGLLVLTLVPGRAAAAVSCAVTVTDGSFGPVAVLSGGSVNTTATLTFSCTGLAAAAPISLCPNLDGGSGGGDGLGGRLLTGSAGGTLGFQVYQDSGRTIPWGSAALPILGTAPTITGVADLAGKVTVTRTLYGKVTASSTAPPGAYLSTFAAEPFVWVQNLASCAGITGGGSAIPAAFNFAASVLADCSLTATAMNFGSVGLLTAAVAATNQVQVRCTSTTPYNLGLGNGLTGASPATRKMTQGAAAITYGIYKDPAHALAWGDISLGLSAVQSATGSGATQTFTAYGLAPVQATPAPAAYADTVVATLTY